MRRAALFFLTLSLPGALTASSFRDVPQNHWAYGAIRSLVKSGLIQGKKGKFDGTKAFSRYEMAVVLARYMEKLGDAKKSVQATVSKTYPLLKKLADEFSKELDLLGIKHQDLIARVTSLETRTDMHQAELQELRALVEENRRLLLQAGSAAPSGVESPVRPRGAPRGRAPLPPVYRRIDPPMSPQAYAPPAPSQVAPAAYPSPAPVAAPAPAAPLFAAASPTEAKVPDSLRLQNLRLRARGLLQGTLSRERTAARPTAPRRQAMQLAARPTPAYTRGEILDTIDQVRAGSLPPQQAQQYRAAAPAPAPLSSPPSSVASRQRSQVYPLSERLFGTLGLGPPSGE